MSNIDVRKVQMVGYSTLSVSLPKDWVKEVGVKAGDVVSIIRLEDGSLRLHPGIAKDEKLPKRVANVDKMSDPGLLKRAIIGLYIIGAETIVVTGKNGLNASQLEEVKSAVQRLNGFGIVEQTSGTITIQSFLDPTKFPIDGLLRRLHTVTTYMLEATFKGLLEKKKESAQEVVLVEEEMDKIYWMTVRQLLYASKRLDAAKKIGIDNVLNIAGNRLVAKLAEKIGDYAEQMSVNTVAILDSGMDLKAAHVEEIGRLYREVVDLYAHSFNALLNRDAVQANRAIERSGRLEKELNEASFRISQAYISDPSYGDPAKRVSFAFALRSILIGLVQTVNFIGTISEVGMNRSLELEGPLVSVEP
ncbi:MAG TPA: phosphate uptake regulator PhoU [Conexivisphaerales archaeon]|nr:phosphate uptake regulator PhoU [Conexivisphaerales archaeon]